MSNANKPFDPKVAVYTPLEVANYGVQAVKDARANTTRGVAISMPEVEDYFAPVLPGQICAVIAQTSNYKSGFFHFIEHAAAQALRDQGREQEIIVHVSTEECIEEQAFLEFARYADEDAGKLARGDYQDWERLMRAHAQAVQDPIYRIGDSLARAENMPDLYLSNMIRAVKYLRDELLSWKPKIAGLFFDYLQAFPIDPEVRQSAIDAHRRLQVRQDVYRLRQAAQFFDCPVFVAVQAKQHLEGANPPFMLPGIYDGEETASIAQRFDRIISLWMPKMTYPVGSFVEHPKKIDLSFTVEEDMLWLKVCKQRGGLPSGRVWRCRVDFAKNQIKPEVSVDMNKMVNGGK